MWLTLHLIDERFPVTVEQTTTVFVEAPRSRHFPTRDFYTLIWDPDDAIPPPVQVEIQVGLQEYLHERAGVVGDTDAHAVIDLVLRLA